MLLLNPDKVVLVYKFIYFSFFFAVVVAICVYGKHGLVKSYIWNLTMGYEYVK